MYAMEVRSLGGPEALERVDRSDPAPGPSEVLVAVEAVGCNFADTLITRGRYQLRPELPFAPGAEAAGTIEAVGGQVFDLEVGQRVLALLPYGGYASHVVVPRSRVFVVPDSVDAQDAAALGVVYQTSYFALVHRAQLQPKETLLVHAAAGGVGLAAVQLGAALGATIIATAGSDEKLELAKEHGADHALSYRDKGWVDAVKRLTDGRGADVVYDSVGGDIFDSSTKCIAWGGRLLVIGFASGRIPELAMNRVMLKNISIVGLHWSPYFEHAPELVADAMAALFELRAQGRICPLVSDVRPLASAAAALEDLAARKTVGKIILVP